MARLVANMDFPYQGRRLKKGEEFTPENAEDERLLTGLKHPRASYLTKVEEIEEDDQDQDQSPSSSKRRRYNRRDMRVEE